MKKNINFQGNQFFLIGIICIVVLLLSGVTTISPLPKIFGSLVTLNCEKVTNCESPTIISKEILGKVQFDIDASIEFPNSLVDYRLVKPNIDAIGWVREDGIIFHAVRSNWLYIKIPMRHGDSPSFNYVLKDVQPKDVVTLRIVKSKSIYILKNNKIAYTHRYQEPVFYYPLTQPIRVSNVPSALVKVNSASYFQTNSISSNLKTLFHLGIIILFSLLPFILYRFRKIRNPVKIQNNYHGFRVKLKDPPIALLLTFWLLSLGMWATTFNSETTSAGKSPFGPSAPFFSDFFQVAQFGLFERPFDLAGIDYPPSTVMFFGILLRIFGDSGFFMLTGLSISLIFIGLFSMFQPYIFGTRSTKVKYILWTPLIFYPLVFGILRGNIDILVCGLTIFAVACLQHEKNKSAIIFLSLAISLKIWPVAFLLIFLKRKKIFAVALSLFLSLIPNIAGLLYLGYTNTTDWLKVLLLPYLRGDYSISQSFQYNYSFKTLVYFWHLITFSSKPEEISADDIANSMRFITGINYNIITGVLAICLLVAICWSRRFTSVYILMCGLVLLVPSPTYTYRGLIIAPYVLAKLIELSRINQNKQTKKKLKASLNRIESKNSNPPTNSVIFTALASICAPVTFIFFGDSSVSIGSIIQPIALMCLIILEVNSEINERKMNPDTPKFSSVAWAGIEPAT